MWFFLHGYFHNIWNPKNDTMAHPSNPPRPTTCYSNKINPGAIGVHRLLTLKQIRKQKSLLDEPQGDDHKTYT